MEVIVELLLSEEPILVAVSGREEICGLDLFLDRRMTVSIEQGPKLDAFHQLLARFKAKSRVE